MKGTCWPKLSVQLTGPRDPRRCQSCGCEGSLEPETEVYQGKGKPCVLPKTLPTLVAWCECDGNDQPTRTIVVLCRSCGDKLIEKHPRLYAAQPYWMPLPGIMGLCLDCRHRDGTACTSPQAKFNGGEGLEVLHPKPHDVHFYRRGKGTRSGWEKVYQGPATACSNREVTESVEPTS